MKRTIRYKHLVDIFIRLREQSGYSMVDSEDIEELSSSSSDSETECDSDVETSSADEDFQQTIDVFDAEGE